MEASHVTYRIKGDKLYVEGRYKEALVAYEQTLQLNSGDADAWNSKGVTLFNLERYEEALKAYEEAIQLDSDNVVAWRNKGNVLRDLSRYEEALQAYKQYLQLNSNDADAWNRKGGVLFNLKRYKEALAASEQALLIDAKLVSAWSNKGLMLEELKRYEEALKAYEEAIHLDSNCVVAWKNKGNLLQNLRRHEEALVVYEQVLKLNPDDVVAWKNKGVVLRILKRHEEAFAAFKKVLNLNPNKALGWHMKGVVLGELKRYEEALKAYEEAIRLDSNCVAVWKDKGNALINLSRYEEALMAFEQALVLDVNFVNAWQGKAVALVHLGRYEEALNAFDQAEMFAMLESELTAKASHESAEGNEVKTKPLVSQISNNTNVLTNSLSASAFNSAQSAQTLSPLQGNEAKVAANNLKQLLNEPTVAQVQTSIIEKPQLLVMSTPSATEKLFSTLHQISWSNIKLGKCQGSGSYGKVYQAHWQGIQVATKKLHLEELTEELKKSFMQEATNMHTYRHPHIVQLYGICQEVEHYALVMEYMEKGSLRKLLSDELQSLTWLKRIKIALDIGRGVQYLHGHNIVHRDLKSANILIDRHYQAKISDFGLAKIKLETNTMSSKANVNSLGSIRWKAPELFKRKATYTSACDIYSYGMVLWELTSGTVPFADENNEAIVMSWIKEGEQEEIPADCPAELVELIKACWSAKPEDRPTTEAIVTRLEALYEQLLQKNEIEAEETQQLEKSQISKLEERLSLMQLENTAQVDKLIQENIQLQQEQKQLLIKIEQLNTEHELSLSKQTQLTKEQAKLKEKIVYLEIELEKSSHTSNQTQIFTLQQSLDFERAEYQKLTEGISDLIQTMDKQEKQIHQLEDKLNDKNSLIEEQSNTIKKMKIAANEKSNVTSDKQNKNESSSEFGNYRTPITLLFTKPVITNENKNVMAEKIEEPKISNNNHSNIL